MTGLLRLYSAHHLLAKSHLDSSGFADLSARIPMARHWYVLHVDATRKPGATLSTQIHGVWRFFAHGTTSSAFFNAHLDAVRLLPGGLDLRNRVRGKYVFDVRDPRHAGFVSLRVYIRDAAGDSELLTVIHAYGIR